ncbi:MAG: metallophosphoesterase [Acidobacteriota bacterium]|nr:metallophosphoesterase [Acidobacteriota bacterium]
MATSLVHIGDFHAGPGPRNAARYRALDQVIAEGLALPALGAWLWPGDLSHQRQTIDDENALIERLRRMSAAAPVVLVYGNHDAPGDLDKFAFVGSGHPIYVVDRPQVLRIRLASMAFASIACLPYPHKHGLVLAGVANPDLVDEAANALDAIFMQFEMELAEARAKGDLTLFIGHANVGGAVTSSGQPNIGREIELSPRHLDRLGPIYKGSNHIHKAQEIHGLHYPGSICRLDWGEIEDKRWLEVVCNPVDAALRGGDGHFHVVPHAIDVAPMYHVEGELTREGFTWRVTAGPGGELQDAPTIECAACGETGDGEYQIGEGRLPCTICKGSGRLVSWKGCNVRLRYRFAQSEARIVNKALLLAEFAEASLTLDPIAVPDRALRAPEVAAAKTLPEKLRAWCELAGTVASDSVLQKLAQLETIADPSVHIEAARDYATDLAAGDDAAQKATVAA